MNICLTLLILSILPICQGYNYLYKDYGKLFYEEIEEEDLDIGGTLNIHDTSATKEKKVEFPYSLQQAIDDHLVNAHYAYEIHISRGVIEFNCLNKVSLIILKKFPVSIFHWVFNGEVVQRTNRIYLGNGKLRIRKVKKTDEGVYICKLEYSPRKLKTVNVFSLVVDSGVIDYDLNIRNSFKLACPSIVFGLLYNKATREWRLNGEFYKRLGRTSAMNFSKENFAPLNVSMTGKWDCVVGDGFTQRLWPVMSFNMKINSTVPSTFSEWAGDLYVEKPKLFGILAATPAAAVIMLCVCLCYRPFSKDKYMDKAKGRGGKDEAKTLQEAIVESDQSDAGHL